MLWKKEGSTMHQQFSSVPQLHVSKSATYVAGGELVAAVLLTCDLDGVGAYTTAATPERGPHTAVAGRFAAASQAAHVGLAQLHDGCL
jgi:hypothetical protein